MITFSSRSPSDTDALAEVLADSAEPGDLLVLSGGLGSGKTAFSKSYGAALGVTEHITSPTFTLAREYAGRLPLFHLDVYRLEHMAEVIDLDLPDLLDSGGVVLIEWGDAILTALPADFLRVSFAFGEDESERTIELDPVGAPWAKRIEAIEDSLDRLSLSDGPR